MDERRIKYAAFRLSYGMRLKTLVIELVELRGYSFGDAYLMAKAGQLLLQYQRERHSSHDRVTTGA